MRTDTLRAWINPHHQQLAVRRVDRNLRHRTADWRIAGSADSPCEHSRNEWRKLSDLLRAAQICLDLLRSAQICSDMLRYAQICSDLLRSAQTCSDLLISSQICSDLHRSAQICSDLLRSAQICSDLLRWARNEWHGPSNFEL